MPENDAIGDAADTAEAASNSTALDVVARSGFAVMALLHIVIGAIAVALVLGAPGQAEPTGAIEQLAANPWGPAVMWAACIACAGLALWQLSEATLRGRHLPRREQLGKLISSGFLAIAYGSVGLSFAGFALGQRGDSGDSTRDFSTALVQSPVRGSGPGRPRADHHGDRRVLHRQGLREEVQGGTAPLRGDPPRQADQRAWASPATSRKGWR